MNISNYGLALYTTTKPKKMRFNFTIMCEDKTNERNPPLFKF